VYPCSADEIPQTGKKIAVGIAELEVEEIKYELVTDIDPEGKCAIIEGFSSKQNTYEEMKDFVKYNLWDIDGYKQSEIRKDDEGNWIIYVSFSDNQCVENLYHEYNEQTITGELIKVSFVKLWNKKKTVQQNYDIVAENGIMFVRYCTNAILMLKQPVMKHCIESPCFQKENNKYQVKYVKELMEMIKKVKNINEKLLRSDEYDDDIQIRTIQCGDDGLPHIRNGLEIEDVNFAFSAAYDINDLVYEENKGPYFKTRQKLKAPLEFSINNMSYFVSRLVSCDEGISEREPQRFLETFGIFSGVNINKATENYPRVALEC